MIKYFGALRFQTGKAYVGIVAQCTHTACRCPIIDVEWLKKRKYIYLNQTLRNNNQEIHISFDDVRFCQCHCHRPVSMWFVSFPSSFFLFCATFCINLNLFVSFCCRKRRGVSEERRTAANQRFYICEPTFMHFEERKNAIQMHFHNNFFAIRWFVRSFVRWLVWAQPSECIRSVFICKRISHFWNW